MSFIERMKLNKQSNEDTRGYGFYHNIALSRIKPLKVIQVIGNKLTQLTGFIRFLENNLKN